MMEDHLLSILLGDEWDGVVECMEQVGRIFGRLLDSLPEQAQNVVECPSRNYRPVDPAGGACRGEPGSVLH